MRITRVCREPDFTPESIFKMYVKYTKSIEMLGCAPQPDIKDINRRNGRALDVKCKCESLCNRRESTRLLLIVAPALIRAKRLDVGRFRETPRNRDRETYWRHRTRTRARANVSLDFTGISRSDGVNLQEYRKNPKAIAMRLTFILLPRKMCVGEVSYSGLLFHSFVSIPPSKTRRLYCLSRVNFMKPRVTLWHKLYVHARVACQAATELSKYLSFLEAAFHDRSSVIVNFVIRRYWEPRGKICNS